MADLYPQYQSTTALQQIMLDRDTGEPLNGYAIFYYDNSRNTPRPVYEIQGDPNNYQMVSLPNPLDIADGMFVNDTNININPYYKVLDDDGNVTLYYVRVFNSEAVEQFDRVGFPPNVLPETTPSDDNLQTTDNQISNGQFSVVNFDANLGMQIEFTGSISNQEYEVAPGWIAVVSSTGSGSIEFNQIPLAGVVGAPGNPPFMLDYLPFGANVSSIYLKQKLDHNPDIWGQNNTDAGYIATYLLLQSMDGSTHTVTVEYAPSNELLTQIIATGETGTSGFSVINQTTQLDEVANTDESDIGYVDIKYILPTTGHIRISNAQIVSMTTDQDNVPYYQETVNRQIDHLFHYYNEPLQYKPIPSHLCGWDFPFNPAQFGESGTLGEIGSNRAAYVWDQTILFQSINDSVSYSRDSRGGLFLTTTKNTQIAVIQYLDFKKARSILGKRASANVAIETSQVDGINSTLSLWYTTDAELPDIADETNEVFVSSLDADGLPASFNGNWVQVKRNNGINAFFNIEEASDSFYNNYSFSGWDASETDAPATATYFAIVLGTAQITSGSTLSIDSISLVPGDIGTNPAPQSNDEVLRECQYYYEKSYENSVQPGEVNYIGALFFRQNLVQDIPSDQDLFRSSFEINYKQTKRVIPETTVYSPAIADADYVRMQVLRAGTFPPPTSGTNPTNTTMNDWSTVASGKNSIRYDSNLGSTVLAFASASPQDEGQLLCQYSSDARLGII